MTREDGYNEVLRGIDDDASNDANSNISNDFKNSLHGPRRMSRVCLGICISLFVLSLSIVIYSLLRTTLLQHHAVETQNNGREYGHCGHSISEARSNGCLFDPMSWNWVQPACYHEDLISDFLNRTDWHFYTSLQRLEAGEEVPEKEWKRGEHKTLFSTLKYHPVHCTYVWRKMHEAIEKHMPMDSQMMSMQHTKHCGMILVNDLLHEDPVCTGDEECLTLLQADFTTCGYY
jgi:hypothetical protein